MSEFLPTEDWTLGDAVLQDCLASFPHVRLKVTGDCMRPALAPGDVVLLARATLRPPHVGDVVLIRHPEGLRLHRLVWPGGPWGLSRTKGDRGPRFDPPLQSGDLLATALCTSSGAPLRSRWTACLSLLAGLLTRVRQELPHRCRSDLS